MELVSHAPGPRRSPGLTLLSRPATCHPIDGCSIDDCGRFLDGRWADRAAAPGVRSISFGCDRERPFARIDRAGFLWLLSWHKLVALTRDTATSRHQLELGKLIVAVRSNQGVSSSPGNR